MAQRIGPTIGLFCLLALSRPGIAAPLPDPADSPFSPVQPAASPNDAPRYPHSYNPPDDRVQHATYQGPSEARAAADNSPRAANAPAANRPEAMPIGVPSKDGAAADKSAAHGGRHELPPTTSSVPALFSMLGSLAIVLGLFFGLVWFMRRGLPKGTRLLSSEVVEVLGRAPLGGRQQMHVVRFGNKLLLISLTAGGAETLSEIVDPAEVDRLAGICHQSHTNSATNAFRQVFRQFSEDRAPGRRRRHLPADSQLRQTAADSALEDDDV